MNIIVDTGFWFAYYKASDNFHSEAVEIMKYLDNHRILIPFPSLYETINTKFCKNSERIKHFYDLIVSNRCVLIHDNSYKDEALELSVYSSLDRRRSISMVDMVIRQMLEDTNLKTDAIITFNPSDFDDVCRRRSIVLISKSSMVNSISGENR